MSKKIFAIALATVIFALPLLAEAQQQKVYRAGILMIGSSDTPQIMGLRDGLKELGHVEGKNLLLDIPAKETIDELRPIAKACIEKKVDVIVAMGITAPIIARDLTREIPIVFIGATDPIASGLVKSVARPESNVTGVAGATDFEMQGKRLELFKEAVPTLRRVAVLYNARGENPLHTKNLGVLQKVAPHLGLKLIEKPIKSNAEIERVLASVSKDTTDGLFVICSTLFRDSLKKMGAVTMQKKLALIGCRSQDVAERDALLSYGADSYRIGHRAAWYVDQILKGRKPEDLPVESPIYFEFVVNLKTAKQIGVTIPPNVLARANKVIR
jgi:putative ABC transport system substrate-binding protein